MRPRTVILMCMSFFVLSGLPYLSAQAQSDERCFPETGHCISGPIRQFWERNGGLAVFGLPVSPQAEEQIEGQRLEVQWFERNRLELHPEAPAPYDVQLGRIGVEILLRQGRDWQTFPKSVAQEGCRFFAETGHNACNPFLKLWRASGLELDGKKGTSEAESLALLGLPLSDAQNETLSDGSTRMVQWFERGRVELHPQNQPPFDLQLGLLGSEARSDTGSTPAGTAVPVAEPAPSPTATPVPVVPTATRVPVAPTPTAQQAANCDPSYPTVCIPPPPPDLDCGDIPYKRFTVIGRDPHRFDADNDGIGCER